VNALRIEIENKGWRTAALQVAQPTCLRRTGRGHESDLEGSQLYYATTLFLAEDLRLARTWLLEWEQFEKEALQGMAIGVLQRRQVDT
jgi:hypothetical protein